jgi:hypothetical protein
VLRKTLRNLTARPVLPVLAVLLVLIAGAAAHANRPVPYGDRVAVSQVSDASAGPSAADGLELRLGRGLEAYDPRSGAQRWSYHREGAAALHLVRSGADAVLLWDDGLITAVQPGYHTVRWHRAVPGLASWLHSDPADRAEERLSPARLAEQRARTALQPIEGPQPWIGVFIPALAMGFRERDGDLRWTSRPAAGCGYDPWRAARTATTLVVASSCAGAGSGGQALPGEVAGYELEGRRWSVPTGPQARPYRLDDLRVAVTDGPVIGTRVLGSRHGNLLPPCGGPGALFAAPDPGPVCPASRAPDVRGSSSAGSPAADG